MIGRKSGWMCAAVVLAALLAMGSAAPMAAAQGGGGFGGGRGGGFGGGRGGFGGPASISSLPVEYLSWALSLNADQKAKIQAIQDKTRTDMRALFPAGGPGQPGGQRPDFTTMRPKMQAIQDQAKKDVEAVLSAAQLKREPAVVKAAGIYRGAGIPLQVVSELKLTAAQNTKLAEISTDATKERDAAMKDAQGDQTKMQALRQSMRASRQATTEKAMAVLTDSQKAAIEKYNLAHPRPTRGAGGRRGGNNTPPAS